MNDRVLAVDAVRSAARPARSKALTITLLASLGLHLIALVAALLLLPRSAALVDEPQKPAEVELVMEEQKGDAHPPNAPSPAPPAAAEAKQPPAPPATAEAKQPPAPSPDAKPEKADAPAAAVKEPVAARPDAPKLTTDADNRSEIPPAPAQTPDAPPAEAETHAAAATPVEQPNPPPPAETPTQQAAAATSAPRAPQAPPAPPAPTISLSGTDSPSNARAWGDHIIPAAPDAVFHNRPPEYPEAAAANGEHGTVVVLIHVSPSGTAAGVDVVRSSGYVLLDRAAREAVGRWRFLPAVKDGQPVSSEMQMGFVFDYE